MKKILVIGSTGQIGSDLTFALRNRYGNDNVIATGHISSPEEALLKSGPFEYIDITQRDTLEKIVEEYDIDSIFNMAAILSTAGEENPQRCWDVNVTGVFNILETARENNMTRVFIPSSIAVFGLEIPRANIPQDTILRPRNIYGLTKVTGELLGEYYFKQFNVDVRGIRYPGIITSKILPGEGVSSLFIEIFIEAIKHKRYTSFLKKNTKLPMIYIQDCIKATINLMEADIKNLKHHCGFNIMGMDFTIEQLVEEITKRIPGFICTYKPDHRQKIADIWPQSLDDSAAQEEWQWKPSYDHKTMTADMIKKISTPTKF